MTQADLNWEDLRFFLRAAQANTLAGTARLMGVEHTTIGRRLTALEKQLGVKLFVRGPRGLALTLLGKRLLPLVQELECGVHAVQELAVTQRERVRISMPPGIAGLLGKRLLPLVQELECGVHAVQELAVTQRERVRISMPPGIAGLLMPHLQKLQREHPDVTIETVSSGRAMGLKRGEVDLAIRLLPVSDESLIVRQLPDMAWSLYAAPAYLKYRHAPNDIDDLSGHDLIAYGSDVAAQPAARWMEARSQNARVILRANEIDTAVTAAVDGAGLAILPCFFADRESRLRRLTPEVLATRSMWLVYRSDARLSKPIKVAVKFVIESMRANAARLAGAATATAR